MTAPVPDPSVPDAGIAEVLVNHAWRPSLTGGVGLCSCGWQPRNPWFARVEHTEHVAAVLAAGPVARQVRQARAEAWGEGAWAATDAYANTWGDMTHNPYRADREEQGHDGE